MKYNSLKGLYYNDKELWEETYNKRINGENVYKFNIDEGKEFFVVITPNILDKITLIGKLDKILYKISKLLPKQALDNYTKLCIIDEIKGTNDIEGVASTREEISSILDNLKGTKSKRLHGLIQKYYLLMTNDEEIESVEDIRKIYDEIVLKEVVEENPNHMPDGTIFRKDIVRVENSIGKVIHHGISSEDKIIIAMQKVLSIMKDESINPFIKIPVVHYLIAYIHPFYDGNGRLIRYITSRQLVKQLEPIVGYKIAYTLKSNLSSYLKLFVETNEDCNRRDLTLFVYKFLEFIIKDLDEAIDAMKEAADKFIYFSKKLKNLNLSKKEHGIYNELLQNSLFDTNGIDIQTIKMISPYSDTYIRKVLNLGVSQGLIDITKVGKKLIYDLKLDELDKIV